MCTSEKQVVLKYSPETDCKKVPRELCGPSGCILQPGAPECFDKKETVITEVLKSFHMTKVFKHNLMISNECFHNWVFQFYTLFGSFFQVPEETCNLEPQKSCKHVTKLVPLLKPSEECVDIPKEVCSRQRTNPRKVQKPVVKKWCYVPTAESGLA